MEKRIIDFLQEKKKQAGKIISDYEDNNAKNIILLRNYIKDEIAIAEKTERGLYDLSQGLIYINYDNRQDSRFFILKSSVTGNNPIIRVLTAEGISFEIVNDSSIKLSF